MTLSAPPCPHLAAIDGGFGPHYGRGSAGQPDIQATWRCGCRAQNGLRRPQTVRADAHYVERRPHDAPRTCAVHPFTKEHVMLKVSRSRSSAIHPPSNAATPVVRLRVMQSRLRRPLVVDAAWRRDDRVRPRFSLDHLTSRPLTRYERLGFLFAITIPRPHRSLPPLVPV